MDRGVNTCWAAGILDSAWRPSIQDLARFIDEISPLSLRNPMKTRPGRQMKHAHPHLEHRKARVRVCLHVATNAQLRMDVSAMAVHYRVFGIRYNYCIQDIDVYKELVWHGITQLRCFLQIGGHYSPFRSPGHLDQWLRKQHAAAVGSPPRPAARRRWRGGPRPPGRSTRLNKPRSKPLRAGLEHN